MGTDDASMAWSRRLWTLAIITAVTCAAIEHDQFSAHTCAVKSETKDWSNCLTIGEGSMGFPSSMGSMFSRRRAPGPPPGKPIFSLVPPSSERLANEKKRRDLRKKQMTDSWSKVNRRTCPMLGKAHNGRTYPHRFSNRAAAQSACAEKPDCFGILDYGCDASGTYYLCEDPYGTMVRGYGLEFYTATYNEITDDFAYNDRSKTTRKQPTVTRPAWHKSQTACIYEKPIKPPGPDPWEDYEIRSDPSSDNCLPSSLRSNFGKSRAKNSFVNAWMAVFADNTISSALKCDWCKPGTQCTDALDDYNNAARRFDGLHLNYRGESYHNAKGGKCGNFGDGCMGSVNINSLLTVRYQLVRDAETKWVLPYVMIDVNGKSFHNPPYACKLTIGYRLGMCAKNDCSCKGGLIRYSVVSEHTSTPGTPCETWFTMAISSMQNFFNIRRTATMMQIEKKCRPFDAAQSKRHTDGEKNLRPLDLSQYARRRNRRRN